MLRKFILGILISITTLIIPGCNADVTTDTSSDNEVVIKEEKGEEEKDKEQTMRIISGTVASTGVLDKLNLDLVGIPTTDYQLPERYTGIQEIGSAIGPNFEIIVSLTPDLFITDKTFEQSLAPEVEQYGVNTYFFDTTNLESFTESIKTLGKLTDREKRANDFVTKIETTTKKVVKDMGNLDNPPTVAIIFGTAQSFMLASDTSYVGDLLHRIGINNVTDTISGVDSAYINFSQEKMLELNPDYILRLYHANPEETAKAFDDEFATNPAWSSMSAIKEGRVIDLETGIFGVSANVQVEEAIQALGEMFNGEE